MKTRVLEIIDTLNIGGIEKALVGLLSAIDRNKFEILVLPLLEAGGLAEVIRRQGIEVIPAMMKSRFDLRCIASIRRLIKERRIDIVHTHLPSAALAGGIAGRLAKVKVVMAWASMVGSGKLIGRRPYLRNFLTRLLSLSADRLIVPSPQVKEWLSALVGVSERKIEVVYYGVKLDSSTTLDINKIKEEFRISPNEKVVGMVARLDERKDHKTLLRAARGVIGKLPEVKFLLVGEGPMREELEEFAREEGIEDKVIFAGERKDVPALLRICDILALSSRSEGLGLVLLEGMAAGLPIVATAVGGVPEVVEEGKNGLMVPGGDSDALSRALLRLLNDEKLARRLGEGGKRRVASKFSLDRMARETERLYRELLGKRGGV